MTLFEHANKTPTPFFPLREGFRASDAKGNYKLAAKVADVLVRKAGLGSKAYGAEVPYHFSRGPADYVAYFFMTDDEDISFRINFAIDDDSMSINSIDLYKGIKELDDPDMTLSILDPSINIVQLVNTIGEKFLKGDATPEDMEEVPGMMAESTYAEKLTLLKEASKKDAVIMFLKTQGGGYSDYIRWATANNHEIGSQTMYSNAKKVFDAQGGVSPSSGNTSLTYGISPAEPEEPLYDPEDEDVFEEAMESEAVEKFEELEVILRRMANADTNLWALFVYGSPGVGKSFSMKRVFEEEAAALKRNALKVVTKTGGIAGSTGLLQLLYDHKRGHILILDDNDKILSDQTAANYLKGALNTDIEDRHVTYSIADRSALFAQDDDEEDEDYEMDEELDESIHIFERDGKFLFETAKRQFVLPDVDQKALKEAKDKDGESIRDFYFRSRMIFISNLMEVPAAVDDRCYSVDMVFTYEQIIELIQTAMEHIAIEGIDMELRMEVLAFLRRSRFAIERKLGREVQLTFRKFRNACIAWQSAAEKGLPLKRSKSWAMRQLKGSGSKKR